jgi:putative transcriptional regulator
MANHHPDDSLLIEYAAGSLNEAKGLLVATHLALCPSCRKAVQDGEVVGGAILQSSTYHVGAGEPREPTTATAPPDVHRVSPRESVIPNPLRDYLGTPLSEIRWAPLWRGMNEFALPQFAAGVRLLSIPGGGRMPRHTHDAEELTLVLQGAFGDATGHYARGDVATADASIDHRPHADAGEQCICLAVEDGALRLTGWTGRLVNVARAVSALLPRKRD